MELYFLRHGEAGKKDEWKGNDRKRPLSAEGVEQIKQVASAIFSLNLHLDLIISSPFLRARQTAEIVEHALRSHTKQVLDDRLMPGFGPVELAEIIGEYSETNALMLVGHDPDFSQTIAACTGGSRVECKKGGLARVDIADAKGLRGTLLWLVPPRLLSH